MESVFREVTGREKVLMLGKKEARMTCMEEKIQTVKSDMYAAELGCIKASPGAYRELVFLQQAPAPTEVEGLEVGPMVPPLCLLLAQARTEPAHKTAHLQQS